MRRSRGIRDERKREKGIKIKERSKEDRIRRKKEIVEGIGNEEGAKRGE